MTPFVTCVWFVLHGTHLHTIQVLADIQNLIQDIHCARAVKVVDREHLNGTTVVVGQIVRIGPNDKGDVYHGV